MAAPIPLPTTEPGSPPEEAGTCLTGRASLAPPLWPAAAACLVAALCTGFSGSFNDRHHGDTLVPVLTSLYRWTPFYWEANRFGMLVPLLAWPVKHPLLNLIAQTCLTVLGGLAMFVLLPRTVLRAGSWVIAGCVSAAAFLLLTPAGYRFEVLSGSQCYGVSLALAAGAVVLAEAGSVSLSARRWRMAAALALSALAHWVNLGVALVMVPLVLLRGWIREASPPEARERRASKIDPALPVRLAASLARATARDCVPALLTLGLGFAFGSVLVMLFFDPSAIAVSGFLPPAQWPASWAQLAGHARDVLGPSWWPSALGVLALVGLVLSGPPATRRRSVEALRAAAALGICGIGYAAFVGTLRWVQLNEFHHRYLMPSVVLVQTALVLSSVVPLVEMLDRRITRFLAIATATAIVVATVLDYGTPSLAGVHGALDRTTGMRTQDILAARCTHVAGSYWKVWPSVFHANLALREHGSRKVVWGVAERCGPTRDLWSSVTRETTRVAVALDDSTADDYLRRYFSGLKVLERRATVRVYGLDPGR